MPKLTQKAPSSTQTYKIEGLNGPVEVAGGEFYINTKDRARRMMLNSLSADARRVYACLELATMGYQRERATTLDRGKKRDLTPADICDQTGLSRQHVRAGLAELEAEGLAERRAEDGGRLRRGNVVLYCWAFPRKHGAKVCSRAQLHFPEWFPLEWAPLKALITRRKLLDSLDEESARSYIEEGAKVSAQLQNAENVAARFLERVCAPLQTEPAIRKKESEIKNPPPPPAEASATRPPDDEEDSHHQPNGKPNTDPPSPPEVPTPPRPLATQMAIAAGLPPAAVTFATLTEMYPTDKMDHAKAAAQWKHLTTEERQTALAALPNFLECARWTQTPRYIPLCSNWLARREYLHPPPPVLPKTSRDATDFGLPSDEEGQRAIEEAEAEDRRRRAERREHVKSFVNRRGQP